MSEITKPTAAARFASTGSDYLHENDVTAEPSEGKKSKGWFARIPPLPYEDDQTQDMPPFRWMNWLHRWTYYWINKYFEQKMPYYLGNEPDELVTIASNSIAPTQEGARINTSGAVQEELQTADQTDLQDGRLLMIRPNGDTTIIELKHNDGAAGSFIIAEEVKNFLKSSTKDIWLFQRVGTEWREIIRPVISKPVGRGSFCPLMQTAFKLPKHTGQGQTLSAGGNAFAVAFDGTYIWATIRSTSQVKKIDPTTNQVVETISVGTTPQEIHFCGRYIWVSNSGGNSISKIDPTTDTVITTITDTFIDNPRGIVTVGDEVWVANFDRNAICRIDRFTDTVAGSETAVGTGPIGIAYDGSTFVYVVNNTSSDITKITASSAVAVGTYSVVGTNPVYAEFDGNDLWVTNDTSGTVSKVAVPLTATPSKIADTTVGTNPRGVLFDGVNIYVFNYGSDDISAIETNSGTVLQTYAAINEPNYGASDGIHIWIPNVSNNIIQRLIASREYLR